MISMAQGQTHYKTRDKYGDTQNPLVILARSGSATSGFGSDEEQAQSHLNDPDEEEVFQFLSGLDTSYSGRTRAHVLKKHQKRRREAARWRKLMSPDTAGSARHHFLDTGDKRREPLHQLIKVSPQSMLSAHRSDPFDTFPLTLTTREQFIADHYVNVLIPQFYAGSPQDPFNINKLVLFPNAIQDPAAVTGALTFAAHHLAMLQNQRLDKEFFDLRSKSIRFLNARMSHPVQRISDAAVYAILGQIALGVEFEEWPSRAVSRVELATHIQGLRVIIRARGGMSAFKGNRWLDWILNWIDLESGGEISAGLTPSDKSTLIAPEAEAHPRENRTLPLSEAFRINDLWSTTAELALLYEGWYGLARGRVEAKSSAFFEESQLNRRLFADPSSTGRQPRFVRLAIVIQLNLLVWDRRRLSAAEAKESLQSIIRAVSRENLNVTGSTTHFLWTLITDRATAGISDHERLWTTTRMLRILDRCSSSFQRRLEMVLLSFLTSEEPLPVWLSWSPVRFTLDLCKDFSQRDLAG